MRRLAGSLLLLVAFAAPAATATPAPKFRDTILGPQQSQTAALRAATSEWGGAVVATNGETVNLFFSDSLPQDQSLALQWADFMTSLVHGSELSTVAIHLMLPNEVGRYCGSGALACYSPRAQSLYAPAQDPTPDFSAKGVLIHEYGHHVASNRLNSPFATIDYGTKRWASYENVCAKAESNELFPGEEGVAYDLNPGEAFAESYRVLNERKLGLTEDPWQIVTSDLYPDAAALAAIEQDVVTPWTANATRRVTATLNATTRSRTISFSSPYDGDITVTPRQSRSVKTTVTLLSGARKFGTSTLTRANGSTIDSMVCGQRSFKVRVQLLGKVTKTTKTSVTLTVSLPA
jgi:hypothetical protein